MFAGPHSPHHTSKGSPDRRVELLLFTAAFVTFGYFHQGGGWNQNGRFAMVRAIVENGTFSIDSHLIYQVPADPTKALRRLPVRDAQVSIGDTLYTLAWMGTGSPPVPLASRLEGTLVGLDQAAGILDLQVARDVRLRLGTTGALRSKESLSDIRPGTSVAVTLAPGTTQPRVAREVRVLDGPSKRLTMLVDAAVAGATGDLAFFDGRFHPNKAPGTSLLAVPGYFLVYRIEKALHIDPDLPRVLTLNAWLTSVLSVGIVSALGVLIFHRMARQWGANRISSLAGALVFGFATMFLPYATMLYEHNIVAVALLASFSLMHGARKSADEDLGSLRWSMAGSGLCAGYAAITNYLAGAVVVMFGLYAFRGSRRKASLLWFAAGVAGPFLLICFYNSACFGTPFTTNYGYQNPSFETSSFLGVFAFPSWQVCAALLVSPFRGLFFSTPVLILGVVGLLQMLRTKRSRVDGVLLSAVVAFFLLTVSSFNGWHGGSAVTPRYLLPAIPFLALPMVLVFPRWPRLSAGLASISAMAMLVTTAVDPQVGYAIGGLGSVPGRPDIDREPLKASFAYSPLTDYELPFLFGGRPVSLLRAYVEGYLERLAGDLTSRGVDPEAVQLRVDAERRVLTAGVEAGKPVLTPLSAFDGPLSVNPMDFDEGGFFDKAAPHSNQARFHSFNVGEFLWPARRLSLVPLLAVVALMVASAVRLTLTSERAPTASAAGSDQPKLRTSARSRKRRSGEATGATL